MSERERGSWGLRVSSVARGAGASVAPVTDAASDR